MDDLHTSFYFLISNSRIRSPTCNLHPCPHWTCACQGPAGQCEAFLTQPTHCQLNGQVSAPCLSAASDATIPCLLLDTHDPLGPSFSFVLNQLQLLQKSRPPWFSHFPLGLCLNVGASPINQVLHSLPVAFPGDSTGTESTCSARDTGDSGFTLGRKIPWRRKWKPTPLFLPGESHGQRSSRMDLNTCADD